MKNLNSVSIVINMGQQLIKFLIFFPVFSIATLYKAQIQQSDPAKVDSVTFARTRNAINALPNSLFEKQVYTEGEKKLPYRLLFPKNYNKNKKYPLILTFHNSSRIGNDNEKQLEHLSKIWIRDEIYSRYHAFVIAPQFNERSSVYSKNDKELLTSHPYHDIKLVLNLLNQFQKEYNVDPSRIYLVGYSMGASTAQNIMNINPGKFAAIVSVAAVPDFTHLNNWKNKSIFLIHGRKDTDNPYEGSLELFNHIKGNKNLLFKTYEELDHNNITIPLLLSDEIPDWLFRQKK